MTRPVVPETPDVDWHPDRRHGGLELLTDGHQRVGAQPGRRRRQRSWPSDRGRGSSPIGLPGWPEPLDGSPAQPRRSAERTTCREQRRFSTVETKLTAYRKVRKEHGGSVNDVVLATIAGGLRSWFLTRAEPVSPQLKIKAMVPMSVVDDEFAEPTSLGSQVAPHLLTLPVAEANPVLRLHQVSYAFKAHKETGRAVRANKLAEIPGFAPTTFHALGARVAAQNPPRSYNILITNVPGPQFPLYAAGSRMLASYPVLPLVPGHALAIGATSYDGKIFYGIDADRDAVPDVDVLGQCLVEALDELVDASSATRARAPRGRVPRKKGDEPDARLPARARSPTCEVLADGGLAPDDRIGVCRDHPAGAGSRRAWARGDGVRSDQCSRRGVAGAARPTAGPSAAAGS